MKIGVSTANIPRHMKEICIWAVPDYWKSCEFFITKSATSATNP